MVESCLLAEWSVIWMITFEIGWFMTSLMDNFVYYLLCISTSEYMLAHAWACVCMEQKNLKCFKIIKNIKNILFLSCVREAHVRVTYKYEQKWSFLAFRSDSQTLVDTQKLAAPERFRLKSNVLTKEPHEHDS